MKISLFLRSLFSLAFITLLCGKVAAENKGMKSICSWGNRLKPPVCAKNEFRCHDSNKCILREMYCNDWNNCGDNSDEKYCDVHDYCPMFPTFYKCENTSRCIPFSWICNGYSDCPYDEDEDEFPCSMHLPEIELNKLQSLKNVLKWLHNQKVQNSSEKWGTNVDKLALLLYLTRPKFNVSDLNEILNEIAYELNIKLLYQLTKTKLEHIPSTDLASYLNAFLAMCVNPRNFHGYDIVENLRNRVDRENYTNPYVLLALCNAGETITESDKKKLTDTFWIKHRTFWKDMQAVVVMALTCASKQPGNDVDSETLQQMMMELQRGQHRNGTIINLPTTALILQAVIATDSDRDSSNLDEVEALEELLRNQKPDGSFGDLTTTLLVTPILVCRTLMDVNSDHCHYGTRDESSALENLSRLSGPKMRVQYSVWIGNERDLERNLILRVPQNMSLYGVMETAAEIDSRFKFKYSVKDRKPYIHAISGIRDNPLIGKFWFLYVIQNEKPVLFNESPADIIPKDSEMYVMWYRRGTWVD